MKILAPGITFVAIFLLAQTAAFAIDYIGPGDRISESLGRRDQTLDDDCYFDEFYLNAEIGQLIQVTQISDEIDSYLMIVSPSGDQWENDDYSESYDARVSVLISEPGEYSVICSSYSPESGDYEVEVEEITKSNFYGIFVGIEYYGREWEDAPLCDQDAEELRDSFIRTGLMEEQNAILLTNRDAEYGDVEDAFDEISRRIGPDDTFVFFFSGHGDQIEATGDEWADKRDNLDEVICLKDKDLDDNSFAMLMDEINAKLSLVVIDSCNSGGIARDIMDSPGRVVFASSEEDVLSDFATDLNAGGYLSVFFRDAIEGEADLDGDGIIMMGELTRYLLLRYSEDIPSPESAIYGYQELVHDRGTVSQDTIFFWNQPKTSHRRH
jgi:hypothetical protein